jgi:hypothetical protein
MQILKIYFIAGFFGLICILYMFSNHSSVPEKLALTGLMVIIAGYVWSATKTNKASAVIQARTIDDIIKLLEQKYKTDYDIKEPTRIILNNDSKLIDTLVYLIEFYPYDKDGVYHILKHLFEFYGLYTKLLLKGSDVKNIEQTFIEIVDKRMACLRTMSTLYISIPYVRHAKLLENISLQIQAATYKCMNVLKNKYGNILGVGKSPYAHNVFDIAMQY